MQEVEYDDYVDIQAIETYVEKNYPYIANLTEEDFTKKLFDNKEDTSL